MESLEWRVPLDNYHVIIISGEPLNSTVAFILKIFNFVQHHLEDDGGGGGALDLYLTLR